MQGHQRINLPLATVLTPAGTAKEMTQRASRQICDEIRSKIAYKKPKELDSEYVHGLKPQGLVPKRHISHQYWVKFQACAMRMPQLGS